MVLSAQWKTDLVNSKYTLTAQAVTGASNTAVGAALTKSAAYTTESTDSITISSATLAAFSPSDFADANFKVRLRFHRDNGNVANSTAFVDQVQVVLTYHLASTTASVVYQTFGIGSIPAGATAQVTAEVKWKASAVNANATLGMQLYKNWGLLSQASIGTEVTRSPAAANTTYVDSTGALSVNGADLADSSFAIRLRATRIAGAPNPDITASIDYVRVSVNWSTVGTTTTHSLLLKGFGLDQLVPSGATVTSITTSARWKLSATNTHVTLGLQAYKDGGVSALGTEVTDSTGPTTITTATQTVVGGLTVADLSDSNFAVRVRASRNGTAALNPDVTAYLDDVTVQVAWSAPSVTYAAEYGAFGFNAIPSDATVTEVKTEVAWKASASSNRAEFGVRAYIDGGATPVGAELVDSSPATSLTTKTQTITGLALSPSDLADGNFVLRLRVTRESGNSNPDFTASIDSARVTIKYNREVTSSVTECNPHNNWSATKLSPDPDACQDISTPVYTPFSATRMFQSVCPSGQLPTWRKFGYTASTPGDSSIEFRFRAFATVNGSCVALPAITSGTEPAPLATAGVSDPDLCALTSTTAPCPIDLFAGLGETAGTATLECLQMDVYGIPSGSFGPELVDWTATYTCSDAL